MTHFIRNVPRHQLGPMNALSNRFTAKKEVLNVILHRDVCTFKLEEDVNSTLNLHEEPFQCLLTNRGEN